MLVISNVCYLTKDGSTIYYLLDDMMLWTLSGCKKIVKVNDTYYFKRSNNKIKEEFKVISFDDAESYEGYKICINDKILSDNVCPIYKNPYAYTNIIEPDINYLRYWEDFIVEFNNLSTHEIIYTNMTYQVPNLVLMRTTSLRLYDILHLDKIGSGGFGKVYIDDSEQYIIKVVKHNKYLTTAQMMEDAEINNLAARNGLAPFIYYIGTCSTQLMNGIKYKDLSVNTTIIIMDYVDGEDYYDLMMDNPKKYLPNILDALDKLYKVISPYGHGDTNFCNIMVDDQDDIKFIDFTYSKKSSPTSDIELLIRYLIENLIDYDYHIDYYNQDIKEPLLLLLRKLPDKPFVTDLITMIESGSDYGQLVDLLIKYKKIIFYKYFHRK